MDIKNIFSKILSSIIGFLVIGSLISLFQAIILTIFFVSVNPESVGDWLSITYSLIVLFNIIAGIYFGLKSYKLKDIWYTVFKPTKNNAIISLILSIAFAIFLVVAFGEKSFVSTYTFKPILNMIAIPLLIISYFIIFYPFSALCNFVYKYKQDILFKNSKAIIIILLILLNPLFTVYSGVLGVVYRYEIMNEPCGVRIVGFIEPSPAKDSGIQVDEIIFKVNDIEIKSISDLKGYLDAYDPSIDLIIHTKSNSYPVEPHLQDGRYLLGVNLTREMCKRSISKL